MWLRRVLSVRLSVWLSVWLNEVAYIFIRDELAASKVHRLVHRFLLVLSGWNRCTAVEEYLEGKQHHEAEPTENSTCGSVKGWKVDTV